MTPGVLHAAACGFPKINKVSRVGRICLSLGAPHGNAVAPATAEGSRVLPYACAWNHDLGWLLAQGFNQTTLLVH